MARVGHRAVKEAPYLAYHYCALAGSYSWRVAFGPLSCHGPGVLMVTAIWFAGFWSAVLAACLIASSLGHLASAAGGTVEWGSPTLVSTHLGRSDADTFHAGFGADRNVVIGGTHSGDHEIAVQSTDGGLTFAELWRGGVGTGRPYGWINGSLQSVGNVSRYNHPAVSELQGNAFSVLSMDPATKKITRQQHCCLPGSSCGATSPYGACSAAERISWSGLPTPTMSFTLYSGSIISLANGQYGKAATVCNNPVPSASRPYGCTLVPRHDPSTGKLVWGARNLSVWWFTSDNARHWRYTSVVSSTAQCQALGLAAEEGPNEPAVSLLADSKTLLAIMRRDGGDGWPHHSHRPYIKTFSSDNGLTWRDPVSMAPTVLSARPMLQRVSLSSHTRAASALVMTGGRPGLNVWINWAGDGDEWVTFNLADIHNRHVTEHQGGHKFCDEYVHGAAYRYNTSQSSAYNSVVALGPSAKGLGRALTCYPLGGSDLRPGPSGSCHSNKTYVYCMQLTLSALRGVRPLK